jgi:HTH-type transcriptional regulator, sugar sensing transcriptional regulator
MESCSIVVLNSTTSWRRNLDIIESLMKVGFSKHEAVLYFTLCKEGELSGYEASKITGITRSNAYLALAGLVDKGGVHKIDGESAKYIAVNANELVQNMRREYHEIYDFIVKNVPQRKETTEPYVTITGKLNIVNKMKNIVDQAKERIYISMAHSELEHIKQEINSAVLRGLKVVVITSDFYLLEGVLVYKSHKQPGQIRLIADSSHVLSGEIAEQGDSTCLYSKNKNLIELIKDSLSNEIKLIQINTEKEK